MSYSCPEAHMLLSGTLWWWLWLMSRRCLEKKKREDWSRCILCWSRNTRDSMVQQFPELITTLIAHNCIHDKFSHCLNVEPNEMCVWETHSTQHSSNICNHRPKVLMLLEMSGSQTCTSAGKKSRGWLGQSSKTCSS